MSRFPASCLMVLFLSSAPLAAEFNPKDLDHLVFFVESVRGMVVTTNNTQQAYDATNEFTSIKDLWSDQKRFPKGTVRWWKDQSPYKRAARLLRLKPNCPFKTGRDFGQDDHDRPGYVPDGCNGKPCARGGLIPDKSTDGGPKHHKQPCYFEMQPGYGYQGDVPFSVFLLARPVKQKEDFVYFGVHHWSNLRHHVEDDSLMFKNGGRWFRLSQPKTVQIGRWQLIEVHRDRDDRLTVVVNGKDVTAGTPTADGLFRFNFVFNNNKGQKTSLPMIGDIAAVIVYSDELSAKEKRHVRSYLNRIYKFADLAKNE